jgi:hypothetical protein
MPNQHGSRAKVLMSTIPPSPTNYSSTTSSSTMANSSSAAVYILVHQAVAIRLTKTIFLLCHAQWFPGWF